MKIALFGGTFNPPHIGHIRAAKSLCREICPDLLYILPASLPPHKTIDEGDNPAHRFAMARLAFRGLPCDTVVSALELCRRGKSYTSDTLAYLKTLHPDAEFFLYVGADMLESFESWHDFRDITDTCTLVTAPRAPEEEKELLSCGKRFEKEYGSRVLFLPLTPFRAASTTLRNEIARGDTKECKKLLTDDILGYIIENGLYSGRTSAKNVTSEETLCEMEQALPTLIDDKRRAHTLSVCETALRLAEIFFPLYGYEKELLRDLRAAALCHDMMKCRTEKELISYLSQFMRNFEGAPSVYHSYASAYYALEKYKVNARVFRSIYYHTTGCADADLFEKLIFLSDYIEPTRSYSACRALHDTVFDGLFTLMQNGALTKESADKILNCAVLQSLNDTYAHLLRENRPVCPELFSARAFLEKELSEK